MTAVPTSAPRALTIFGREPASILGLAEGVLTLAVTFGLGAGLGLSQETFGVFLMLLSAAIGVYTGWATKDVLLGRITGLVKAGIAFVAIYGFTLTDQQVGGLLFATTMVVAFFQRTQTSPVIAPVDPSPTQVINTTLTPAAAATATDQDIVEQATGDAEVPYEPYADGTDWSAEGR